MMNLTTKTIEGSKITDNCKVEDMMFLLMKDKEPVQTAEPLKLSHAKNVEQIDFSFQSSGYTFIPGVYGFVFDSDTYAKIKCTPNDISDIIGREMIRRNAIECVFIRYQYDEEVHDTLLTIGSIEAKPGRAYEWDVTSGYLSEMDIPAYLLDNEYRLMHPGVAVTTIGNAILTHLSDKDKKRQEAE